MNKKPDARIPQIGEAPIQIWGRFGERGSLFWILGLPSSSLLSNVADQKPISATSESVLGEHQYPAVNAGTGETAEKEGAQAKNVHNAELFAAVQETKIKKWSKESPQLYCEFPSYFAAAPVAAIISYRFGRRKALFSGAIVIIVGATIVSTSNTLAQFVFGRFVLGMGIQVMTVAAPAYAVEISLIGMVDAPDSIIPAENANEEAAMDFLVKYHGNGDVNSHLVLLELEEMRDGIRQIGVDKTKFDYRPLFFTHNGRWRMAQVLMISIFGQFSGNGLGYFNTVIFEQLGITSSSQQLGYNLLNSVLSAIGALTAVSLTDRMPRRKVLVIGTFVCVCALAVNSGLSAALDAQGDNISTSYAQGGLAAYFLFNIIFSFTYTPLQAVVVTEALETTTRAKGLAASGVIVSAMGFINQFAGPIALGDIGYRYIYVFVGWDVFESVMWYFFGETEQKTATEGSRTPILGMGSPDASRYTTVAGRLMM
ncbi:putative Major facilitator superfamily (MFS) profile domain-containing protein [Seiridium unicorne]|uniref:Major facilitator superfamily (MFS) profile domain-containing protein n=1 Tax=Seiridium unicorne TaxID=138068 RepID=A0ABR2V4H3_9PEZI